MNKWADFERRSTGDNLSHWLDRLDAANLQPLACSRGMKDTFTHILSSNHISRFYDLDCGQLLINGENIKDLDVSALRKQFSLVSQEPTLYQGEEKMMY